MLQPKNILTPIQRRLLEAFSRLPDQERFYLTGGTALAEFVLGHRLSFDLDFFTSDERLILPFSHALERAIAPQGWSVSVIRRFATFVEFLLAQGEEPVRLDLALDSPFKLEASFVCPCGVAVNSYKDLLADKVLAYYGRAEPRDAVDLWFLLQRETLDELLALAGKKDAGFDSYWFAQALMKAETFPDDLNQWPVKMILPFDPAALKQSFRTLVTTVMARAVPPGANASPGQES